MFEVGKKVGKPMSRSIHKLSVRKCESASIGRFADGGGLYLVVSGKDARSWVFFWKVGRKRREMGLGSLRDVSLARARELATKARADRAAGRDPIAARNARKSGSITFGQTADKLIESMEAGWRNAKHRYQWRQTLTTYAARLRATAVSQITTEQVLDVLKPLWLTKSETAARLRGRIERVLDWAKAHGYRSGENPARWKGHLANLLPRRQRLTRGHHPAMPFSNLPEFMTKVRAMAGIGPRALEFTILTAARTGEVLGARWSEIDFQNKIWTIPAHRMKAGKEHRVPISDEAVKILQALHPLATSEFIFPGQKRGQPLSNMIMKSVLSRAGVNPSVASVHGFRATFKTWASERGNFFRELVEMALAHINADKVEAAYLRGDMLAKRRKLMDAWAQFCCRPIATDTVVQLVAKR
jgi:integrase